jgi:hypothetical protein
MEVLRDALAQVADRVLDEPPGAESETAPLAASA